MGFLDRLIKPSRDTFAERLCSALRAAGLTESLEYDAEQFRILIGGQSHIVFLHNHYAEYTRVLPWKRAKVLAFAVATTLASRAEHPTDFLAARRILVPALRDGFTLEIPGLIVDASEGAVPRPAALPVADDYRLALVLDAPTTMSYVTTADLERWDVPLDRAMEYALDNLRAASTPARFRTVRPGLFASAWADNYDVSRIALPDVVRALPVRGRHVVAVPNRDVLLVTGDEDAEGLAALAARVDAELQKPRPLGGVALVLDGEAWRAFEPEGTSKLAVDLRNLATRWRGTRYAEQKALLEKRNEATGRDVFVASFSGRTDEHGEVIPFAAWTRGVPTLLPRTAQVALVDPERDEGKKVLGLFPWSAVERCVGALMKPEGVVPERWLVESFPDAAALEQLAPHRASGTGA